jgi:cyclic beta-1,2-glucan synthetase
LRSGRQHFSQALLVLIFLPYDAFFSLDAIFRTIWRMLIAHRRLLEWNPSSETNGQRDAGLPGSFRTMWFAPAIALVTTAILIKFHLMALPMAAPFLLAWFISPVIAWKISLPQVREEVQLLPEQVAFLHRLARKIWAFYENFVVAEDNWLPPDNMQEQPVAVVAHRTSPTNIGLALLANLSAYDFGYISVGHLLGRTENTLNTMAMLERHRGHFYNWYDTRTLKPLNPIYISTVDSGNLAGHLLTLRPGLLSLMDQPIVGPHLIAGIDATFKIVLDLARGTMQTQLAQFQAQLESARATGINTLAAAYAFLLRVTGTADALVASLDYAPDTQLNWWTRALARHCHDMRDDLLTLAPWSNWSSSLDWTRDLVDLNAIPTLCRLAELETKWRRENVKVADRTLPDVEQRQALTELIALGSSRAVARMAEIERLAMQSAEFAQMEYGFLYDKATRLMTIGYAVAEQRCDLSHYDLLASEVRLCSFVMIAQGQLPQESWFALGRQLTIAGGEPILLSWSGSMFEYLMPLLVMPTYDNTLLDQTYKSVVQRHIEYGAQRGVPWGISESGFHTFDASLNYQYRAFGVPGLGLKRGLGDDLVVAPYASMLALMVEPEQATSNLKRLSADGFEGKFGLYEAIDYTPSRLPRGQSCAVIQSFMAHHQGMGLLSLAYFLLDRPMQKRFESDPLFQATMLLLQERIPKAAAFYANTTELADIRTTTSEQEMPMRILNRPDTKVPEIQLLSNGRYHLMMTNAGGSYSRWKDLAVTRWREDSTCDNWGSFCYVRDMVDGAFWSTTYQPTLAKPDNYEVIFSEGRVEFRRRDNQLEMHTEIVVSPEDDIEIRRTHITNRSRVRRTIDITSYTEVVLAPPAADAAHPAFSNLFVQTEILAQQHAIICTRRPRSAEEHMPWMLNLMVAHGADIEQVSYETDRSQFIGRGNSIAAPRAMQSAAALSGNQGSVLDPIAAIRFQIELEPEQIMVFDIVTGVAESRDDALHKMAKYQDRHLADRVFELAWTHSQVVLRQLNATESDAQLYARLASSVIYSNPHLRAEASILLKNRRGQSGLWSYAISGDLPIVLLKIKNPDNIDLVRQMVQAHAYWRLKGLAVDLVIWNEDHAGYRQVLQEQIMGLIASGIEAHTVDRPGGIFVRLADQMSSEDRILLQSVARVVLSDSDGTLADQISRRSVPEVRVPQLVPTRARVAPTPFKGNRAGQNLLLFNGLGGFAPNGREYVITTGPDNVTPAPWANVLANPHFGTVISESGQAYTWGENAHEFRLTPWNNDSVSDVSGEAFYLRDEESGHFWSPTPLPCRGHGTYVSRHGFGYSVFEHTEGGIRSELWVYVAMDASIKYSVLKVRNESDIERKLSATGYVEWVLGDLRSKSTAHIVTESDPISGALFAHNSYNTEFADRIAFFDVDVANRTFSGDRTEFIGRNGSLRSPAAMSRARLSGKVGAGLDPCAAIQIPFELAPGQEREVVFMLGVAGRRSADVSILVHRYRGAAAARNAREAVERYWQHTLGAVQVETPDVALNLLANGWLMYQTIACRLWARSGYYQSGGAYGFRDQLQDVMALIHTEPHLVREHLLLCAAHQFVEGDVQHWWHPPSDRGVRTHCSDDYLWLPLATYRYVLSTGDTGVLEENVHFLEGRAVNADEDSYYDLPVRSAMAGSLYEHCVRAILRGLRFGAHGLPLIGSCDWNDGMDKVGAHGKGESVWLAFFLYEVLMRFTDVAKLHGDPAFAARCQNEAAQLRQKIEENAWDGEWYRRAYFDDGTPLGSAANAECQIDSISQSWSVLSGAGGAERSKNAMQEVSQRLVRREVALVQLLDPPFNTSTLNPGYIKGYVPGVRENGGQYTHAAVWTAMAFAKLGDSSRAWEVLQLINPINHARTAQEVAVYKVEPYVLAADVYAVSPHMGRGGWTWYTGSSGWMYRLIVESLLGLHLESNTLMIQPCLPAEWKSFKLDYRYRNTMYHITVLQIQGEDGALVQIVDGVERPDGAIQLSDDGGEHAVEIRVRRAEKN